MRNQKYSIIGTAHWSIPRAVAAAFPGAGSQLERYAAQLNGVEINSSFYNHHQPKTFARWAESVPASFQFALKLHQEITHENELKVSNPRLREVIQPYLELGKKFGVLLIQLPKSQALNLKRLEKLLDQIQKFTPVKIALEARNPSFDDAGLLSVLKAHRTSQVVADPQAILVPASHASAGGFQYFRLHGSPAMYKSSYEECSLKSYATAILQSKYESWCMFDNTTFGHATANALQLQQLIKKASII